MAYTLSLKSVLSDLVNKTATSYLNHAIRIFIFQMHKRMELQYLTSLGSLTDKGFINSSECGGVVVDVQQADVDGDMTALTGIIWKANTGKLSC